jgi:hypothetical protein
MAQFHLHPDGTIYVRGPAGIYCDTVANFATDHGLPPPPLLEGAAERLYDDTPDARVHVLADAKGNHRSNDQAPWPFADQAIAALADLLERQRARTAPPPAPPVPALTTKAAAVGATTF